MTKREALWIVIRLIGLWFFWRSLETAVSTVSAIGLIASEPLMPAGASRILMMPALLMCAQLAIGLYLLGGGNLIFNVLNREPDNDDRP